MVRSWKESIVNEVTEYTRRPRLEYEEWRTSLASACAQFDPEFVEPESFMGWAQRRTIYNFTAGEVGTNSRRVERTHRHTKLDGVDFYNALFQLAGNSFLAQYDEVVELKVGDLVVVDATKPLTFLQPDGVGQRLCLHLPRRAFVSHLGFAPPATVSGGRSPAMHALFQLVQQEMEDEELISPQAAACMHLAIYDLLGAHLAPSDRQPASTHTEELFANICRIIRASFTDPDLSPGQVAAEVGISLRYLQKLFTARGESCGRFIQSLRLSHAEHLLHRSELIGRDQPLGEIAFASGFSDYGFFSKKFRQRFGRAPGAHRRSPKSAGTTDGDDPAT
jgi:AraC family transcriptional regulator, positive regulator of tynA and feaB